METTWPLGSHVDFTFLPLKTHTMNKAGNQNQMSKAGSLDFYVTHDWGYLFSREKLFKHLFIHDP